MESEDSAGVPPARRAESAAMAEKMPRVMSAPADAARRLVDPGAQLVGGGTLGLGRHGPVDEMTGETDVARGHERPHPVE